MTALAYFGLGFSHELWSCSHLYCSDTTILLKILLHFDSTDGIQWSLEAFSIIYNTFFSPLLQLSRICIFALLCMGFLLALTAVRLFPAGLSPPFYSCVNLAGKCWKPWHGVFMHLTDLSKRMLCPFAAWVLLSWDSWVRCKCSQGGS